MHNRPNKQIVYDEAVIELVLLIEKQRFFFFSMKIFTDRVYVLCRA